MSRKHPLSPSYNTNNKGALLPEEITTEDFICLKMWVPNLPEYRQALLGQIHSLGKWFFWEKGGKGDTRAKYAAEFWRQIIWEHLQMPSDPCCCDSATTVILHRVNPDTGALEISTDGGTTWSQDPDDPRVSGVQLPPIEPTIGEDNACRAANAIVAALKDQQEKHSSSIDTAGDVVGLAGEIAGAIILLLFTAPATAIALVPVIIGLAAQLLLIGSDVFNALFSEEVWNDVLCIIYCNIGDDATLNQTELNNILADTDSQFSGDLALWLYNTIRDLGVIGLNNSIHAFSGDLSCDMCPCADCLPPVVVYKGTEVNRGYDEEGGFCWIIVDSEHYTPDNNEETAIAWQPGRDVGSIPSGWDNTISKSIHWELVSGATPGVTLKFPDGSNSYGFSVTQGDCVWYMQNSANSGATFRMKYFWYTC